MDSRVVSWLNAKQAEFLLDYLNIKQGYRTQGVAQLSDYSYLITPAFKALEGVLIQVAEDLGFDVSKSQHRIGAVFDESKLQKFYDEVLNRISDLTEDSKQDVQMWLNDARRILRHFRHSPAHFNGEVKPTWDKAFQFGDHLLSVINELCSSLIEANLIGPGKETAGS